MYYITHGSYITLVCGSVLIFGANDWAQAFGKHDRCLWPISILCTKVHKLHCIAGGMIFIYGSCVISLPYIHKRTNRTRMYMIYTCFSLHLRIQYKIDAEKINRSLALWRHNKIKEIDLTIYCTRIFVYKYKIQNICLFLFRFCHSI